MSELLAPQLEAYLRHLWQDALDLRVENVKRYFGGSSKPTYRVDVRWQTTSGTQKATVVLRTTPARSLVDHGHDVEADALTLARKHGLQVPKILARETDHRHLGYPFFLMEEIPDCESQAQTLVGAHYQPLQTKIGRQKWQALGRLAAIELSDQERALFPAVDVATSWCTELEKWEQYYRLNAQSYEPLMEHALRWMHANPPPLPKELSVVHGDFRTGNFLFDDQGEVRAILDWEMSHVGDAMEDVAWAVSRLWGWPDPERPGFLIPRTQAFAIWEESSGLEFSQKALHWWSILGAVKGIGLWSASARKVNEEDSLVAMDYCASWFPYDAHLRELAGFLFRQAA